MGKKHFCGMLAEKMKIKRQLISIYEKIYKYITTLQMYILFPFDWTYKRKNRLNIMEIEETIRYIIDKKCSVSRYGDGEFNLISNHSLGFQTRTPMLVERLREIVKAKDVPDSCLICLPGFFGFENQYEKGTKKFWYKILVHRRKEWYGYCHKNYEYGNADITRCYIELADRSKSDMYFELLKNIWKDKEIIIVEGEKSRLGVGNDLFDNTKSIKRILCPAKNVYSMYDEILKYIIKYIEKDKLLLLALGPTATIMAFDLSKQGYQAIDIGNVDKEYEWCQAKTNKKTINPLKFTMEVKGGENVLECKDKLYVDSVLVKFTS